ncbi:EF-hand domain-containing family member B [Drosophila ficusphila]|uniref:EF-hand domain-containing family member B n=1 Tax=Drosophila ficusphila TaxID=30025 RepID=UPI0007E76D47|nr:EF-hand domain-containing family member B [Drosophila ficusphila]
MANRGHFIERNGTNRAAGLPSSDPNGPEMSCKECLIIAHPEDFIRSHIERNCRKNKPPPFGKLPPFNLESTIADVLDSESDKTRLTTFKEKFREDLYCKNAKLAEVKPTHSKPNHVTNWSQTFGRANPESESLYSTIMPKKSVDQVNREYSEFHEGHIISNNHYFPSEQINRRYTKPFDRSGVFGIRFGADNLGTTMKKCLMQGDEHLTVVSKPWQDYMKRTKGPLGKKFEKYLDKVPDLTFGQREKDKCGVKMLMENTTPCEEDDTLVNALSYLNRLRENLHKRTDFYMMDLIAVFERIDKKQTGHMPLSQILETMHKLHIRVEEAKIRTMLSHFRMFTDEGCSTELVNYDHFCRLLSAQQPLPNVGCIGKVLDNMYNKDTTYRTLCKDLEKGKSERAIWDRFEDNMHVKDLIQPEVATKIGLKPSDISCLRNRDQMERIFEKVVSKEEFERIWQRLMGENKEQDQKVMASVAQFRAEVLKKTAPPS